MAKLHAGDGLDPVNGPAAPQRPGTGAALPDQIVEEAPIGIVVLDGDDRLVSANRTFRRLLGLDARQLLGRHHLELVHDEDRGVWQQSRRRVRRSRAAAEHLRLRYLHADGTATTVAAQLGSLPVDGDGDPHQVVVVQEVASDLDAHTRALRAELEDSQRRFEVLVEHATDPIVVLDGDGTVTYLSPAAITFLGSGIRHVIGLQRRVADSDRRTMRAAWLGLLQGRDDVRQLVVRVRRADGRWRHMALTLSDLRDLDAVGGVVITARDLTPELAVRARLEHQTTHDGLTGLATRELLLEELRAFSDGHAASPRRGALIVLDLSGMSGINDHMGHRTGDYLLRSVARRLEGAVPSGGLVARLSGDEFGILVEGPDRTAEALQAATGCAAVFGEPFPTPGGGSIRMHARFGVALTRAGDGTPTGVLRDANLALTAAQASSNQVVRVCDDDLRRREERRLALEYELGTAHITDQLRLVYQPIVDLGTGRVRAVEALLRWRHPRFGQVGPDEFVPLTEGSGAIVPIGAWVLRTACRQLAAWDAAGPGRDIGVSVNLSARQLLDVELLPLIEDVLADTSLDPGRITLEITETAIAEPGQATRATVEAIAGLGLRIHIDDFGSGYSSFAQLGRFPFHGLKIDRSFIQPLGQDPDAGPVVAALLAVARARGLVVVAEGVEHAAQVHHLRALECPTAQGFLWSRPRPACEVASLLDVVLAPPGSPA